MESPLLYPDAPDAPHTEYEPDPRPDAPGIPEGCVLISACRNGKRLSHEVTLEEVSDLLKEKEIVVWVDVISPNAAVWERLYEEFSLPPIALENAHRQDRRPRAEEYGESLLFLTIRVWSGETSPTDDLDDVTQEVDLFIGPNYLLSLHDGSCSTLDRIRTRWQNRPDRMHTTPIMLLHVLLDTVVDDYFPVMDAMDIEIDTLESRIYAGTQSGNLHSELTPALRLKKRLMLLRQVAAPMRDVVNHLLRLEDDFIQEKERAYYRDLFDNTLRLVEQIDLHRDILGGVMEAVNAQTSNQLNEVMKRMTGISTILMFSGLVAGIYGMNFERIPGTKAPNGFLEAIALMVIASVALIIYFRRIRWF